MTHIWVSWTSSSARQRHRFRKSNLPLDSYQRRDRDENQKEIEQRKREKGGQDEVWVLKGAPFPPQGRENRWSRATPAGVVEARKRIERVPGEGSKERSDPSEFGSVIFRAFNPIRETLSL